jgi:hypothetical protein
MVDIWLRYRDWDEIVERPQSGLEPHESRWYAPESGRLKQCSAFADDFVWRVADRGWAYPHIDTGWHCEHYNLKVYVALASNPECCNWFEDQAFVMEPGEAWRFDNTVTHSMKNLGETDRISLIISMRVEP